MKPFRLSLSALSTLAVLLIWGALGICLWQGVILFKQFKQSDDITPAYYNLNNGIKKTVVDSVDFQAIGNLFYKKEIIESVDTPVTEKKPVVFPDVALQGTIVNSDPRQSLAIVVLSGKQKMLSLGEVIGKSQATIQQVMDEEIVIQLDGERKNIKITRNEASVASAPPPRPRPKPTPPKQDGLDNLQGILAELSNNPSAFVKYVRFTPIFTDGKISSFQISPGENEKIFKQLGLKQNDLVNAISSADFYVETSNTNALGELWKRMKTVDSFTLHLTRDEQQHEVVISLRK